MGKSAAKKRQALAELPPFIASVENLTHEGLGVARREGKAVFVEGGLPGEEVECVYTARRNRRDEARTIRVLQAAPDRVEPRCAHFGLCGGCVLQHLDPDSQRSIKQRWLLDSLRHIGGLEPRQVLEPMAGPVWSYRRRARLGVKWVEKKGRVLVGFRERHSPYLADLRRCEVLDERVGKLLDELARLVESLSVRERLPQIEIAGGDSMMALSFRVLTPPDESDLARLRAFGERHGLTVYLQSGGPDSVRPLDEAAPPLSYRLPEFDLELEFEPPHFIQINAAINRRLIARACELLELGPGDRVLDLFCGLGNFSLALARRARFVAGVEGDRALVEWAGRNAARNGIDNAAFFAADLAGNLDGQPWLQGGYDKIVLDPPRSGALELMPQVAALGARRVVYISCHPATLARDAGELARRFGYRLDSAGVLDMFPHTAHVESIAVMVRD
ncbi:MAG TPA: 23S rRNA (uracil(1939)-C(5))-methyltransferase RlmD [Candidatus Competibacter sp.]|nr:23S rRNA (uracil(1939)-C(5))-methyltransferase RlmD [Candidatus Competibacteraceae bacterium]HRE53157.1 23S rRNA (uracil(1939)-C(5))-methyltransferase RlmD [Candidatus Competibacter sp.]